MSDDMDKRDTGGSKDTFMRETHSKNVILTGDEVAASEERRPLSQNERALDPHEALVTWEKEPRAIERQTITFADIERLARGELRYVRAGCHIATRLNAAEWTEFKNAKNTGFVSSKRTQGAVRTVWQLWCSITGEPYIWAMWRGATRADMFMRLAPGRIMDASIQVALGRQLAPLVLWRRGAVLDEHFAFLRVRRWDVEAAAALLLAHGRMARGPDEEPVVGGADSGAKPGTNG